MFQRSFVGNRGGVGGVAFMVRLKGWRHEGVGDRYQLFMRQNNGGEMEREKESRRKRECENSSVS